MPALLEAVRVSKRYSPQVLALRDVDLEVRAGETLVLIGESGCGKSTLLKLFNRLVEPTAGEVRMNGVPLRQHDPIALRRRIGYVQQDGGLLPHWTVGRNVALVPQLLGWSKERKAARAHELLELVGLPSGDFVERHPRELSGGQRQRAAFARALAADPELVLLDEPFGALDAITRAELQDEFLRLREQLGKTLVLVTHDLHEAFRLADRIAVMKAGSILALGTPAELRRRTRDDGEGGRYVERLLEHVRRIA